MLTVEEQLVPLVCFLKSESNRGEFAARLCCLIASALVTQTRATSVEDRTPAAVPRTRVQMAELQNHLD